MSGKDGADGGLLNAIRVFDTLHGQRVGNHQSGKPEFFPRQIVNDGTGQGGGAIFFPFCLKGGVQDMGGHDAPQFGTQFLIGFQLHLHERFPVFVHSGHSHVGVHSGISVPGIVFTGGGYTTVLESLDGGTAHLNDKIGVISERTGVDNGVVRVGVDVKHRLGNDRESQSPAFFGNGIGRTIHQIGIKGGTQRHLTGEGRGKRQRLHQPLFTINIEKGHEFGFRAKLV